MAVLRKIPLLTITASLISIIVSVAMWRTPDCNWPCQYSFGSGDIEFIYGGGYWKIFTASFVHSDIVHLVGNIIFLYFFGKRVEIDFGRGTWLILYFVSEFVARLSNGVFVGLSTVGISGFIYAMFGYLLVADWQKNLWRTLISRKVYIFFIVFIGMTIIPPPAFLGLSEGDVAHEAHITGFMEGLLLGNFMLRRRSIGTGIAMAILPLAALTTLVFFPFSFWWQMAKDNEKEVLTWQNVELLSCNVEASNQTDEWPRYSPVIVNPKLEPYSVVTFEADGTEHVSELFIIDYETLTVHVAQTTSAKYANSGGQLGQLLEIRDDAGNCIGRFIPEHPDYNIIVIR